VKPNVSRTVPLRPQCIIVSVRRSSGQGRNSATRVHLPNSPRHHAETSVVGMRPRTGRYEYRHHCRPTVLAGVNIRQGGSVSRAAFAYGLTTYWRRQVSFRRERAFEPGQRGRRCADNATGPGTQRSRAAASTTSTLSHPVPPRLPRLARQAVRSPVALHILLQHPKRKRPSPC